MSAFLFERFAVGFKSTSSGNETIIDAKYSSSYILNCIFTVSPNHVIVMHTARLKVVHLTVTIYNILPAFIR